MINKKIVGSTLLALILMVSVGCSDTNKDNDAVSGENIKQEVVENKQDHEKKIMDAFEKLTKNEASPLEVVEFIDNNIETLSKENGSYMVMTLERVQKNYLLRLEDKFYTEDMQQKITKENKSTMELNEMKEISDNEFLALLEETRKSGFKVETAEGSFFPIIDYEFYTKYNAYVQDDMKEYIAIMAMESAKVPAKDAALVISWKEVVERALAQEKFLNQYSDSKKVNDIKQLHERYITFTLYGLNNTPLFDYSTKLFNKEAKAAYEEILKTEETSEFLKTIGDFQELLKNNKYKLTEEIEKYRKQTSEYYAKQLTI